MDDRYELIFQSQELTAGSTKWRGWFSEFRS